MSLSQLEKSYYDVLMRSVDELLALAPWQQLQPTDIFAVEMPETGELFFVQMSGGNSPYDPFELMAYRGPRGLELLWDLNNCRDAAFVADQTADVHALLFKMEDRQALDPLDLDILEDRVPEPFEPVFRAFTPGFKASHLVPNDIHLLTVVLAQTCEIVREVSLSAISFEVPDGGEDTYIIRKQEQTDDGTVWNTGTIVMNLDDRLPKKYPKLKRVELAPLKDLPQSTAEIRLDLILSPFVSPKVTDVTPATSLFTARTWPEGRILAARIEEPGAKLAKFRDSLLGTFADLLNRLGQRPKTVHLEAFSLYDTIQDAAGRLGIELAHHELPPLAPAENDAILKHLAMRYRYLPATVIF